MSIYINFKYHGLSLESDSTPNQDGNFPIIITYGEMSKNDK